VSELPPLHEAVPLAAFRMAHGLDERFGLAHLDPKDFDGLGSAVGITFAHFWEPILAAQRLIPALPDEAALRRAAQLAIDTFDQTLTVLNAQVKLTPEQAEFAVAGFADLLWACVYALLDRRQPPDLEARVEASIAASLHRVGLPQTIAAGGAVWQVTSVATLYGRVGLLVERDGQRWLVADSVYTCPMAQVMTRLVLATARSLQARFCPLSTRPQPTKDSS
jgi:hypothetical protein